MQNILVTIPGDALAGMKVPPERLEAELKKQLALQLYRERLVSGAGACRIAAVTKAEFQTLLAQHEICQQYDVDDYQKDLEHMAAWRASG